MAVTMHERGGLGCELDLKHAYEWILQGEMMMGLGGDLDFGRLRGQQDSTTDN
jgi:hypothetical protein